MKVPTTVVYLGDAVELDADTYSWMWRKNSGFVVAANQSGNTLYVFHVPKTAGKTETAKFNPRCGTGMRVQSYLFDRYYFNATTSKSWLRANGAKIPKVHKTDEYLRYRQEPPGHFTKTGFRTKSLTQGVKAVMGCPLKKWSENPSAGRRLYQKFNRRPPDKTSIVSVPDATKKMGRVHHIAYRSDKFGKKEAYMHVFDVPPTVWTDDPEDPGVLILRGKNIRVTSRGIEG
jgi:hypothetical protein